MRAPSERADADERLSVFAAASLTEVLRRIDPEPSYTFAGSNQLAFQIAQGAPADVFASASRELTQDLFRRRLVERPRSFAANALVVVVPRSNPARVRSVFDLERRSGLKLVVAGRAVPAGSYTRRALERLGLSSVLANVVSEEADVRGVVAKIAVGEGDAGLVYRTDVKPVAARVKAIELPARAQPRVRYEIAVVRSSRKRVAARRFVEKLASSARARRVLRQAGFAPP